MRSSWYPDLTDALERGAREVFDAAGVETINVTTVTVPGSFEIPLTCKRVIDTSQLDGILALGVVVQGKTHHAAEIARACTDGLMRVQLETGTPIAHGVLFVKSLGQARDRARAKNHRGAEAARTLLSMIALLREGKGAH